MKKLEKDIARKEALSVMVFLKNDGQKTIGIPKSLLTDLIVELQSKGSVDVHLADGTSLEVTGLLITGKDFHDDERIILTGMKERMESNNV